MSRFDYNDRYFVPESSSENGEAGSDTVFHYRQKGRIVWATYEGGQVEFGTLVATLDDDGSLAMRYQHVNRSGEFMTGQCRSTPELLPDGRLRLYERWRWTSGDQSEGESIVEEVNGK